MKTKVTIILFFCSLFLCQAQTVELYTPNGTKLYAGINSEFINIQQDTAYWNNWAKNNSLNPKLLGNSSNTYNCHSYAWNMTKGGPTCWLGDLSPVDWYWEDGSYVACNAYEATHIFYSGHHSAVKLPYTYGKYVSKWSKGPLMEHDPEDVPSIYGSPIAYYKIEEYDVTFYTSGGSPAQYQIRVEAGTKIQAPSPAPIKQGYVCSGWSTSPSGSPLESFPYWVKSLQNFFAVWEPTPVISGSTTICYGTPKTFSVPINDWKSGYYWDSSNSLVNISNPSSSSTTISVASSSSQGSASVYVKNSSGTTLDSYNVWVGKPPALSGIYWESGGNTVGSTTLWHVNYCPSGSTVHWSAFDSYQGISGQVIQSWVNSTGVGYANIYFSQPGYYTVSAYTSNDCGSSSLNPVFFENNMYYPGHINYYHFIVYQYRMIFNPDSNEIEISIDGVSAGATSRDQFTVTISDSSGATRSSGNYSGNKFTVPVRSLADGTYSVRISNGTISETQQLVIKR